MTLDHRKLIVDDSPFGQRCHADFYAYRPADQLRNTCGNTLSASASPFGHLVRRPNKVFPLIAGSRPEPPWTTSGTPAGNTFFRDPLAKRLQAD